MFILFFILYYINVPNSKRHIQRVSSEEVKKFNICASMIYKLLRKYEGDIY
jgi:hypothetical protein